jgi:hypothetical protein
VFVLLLLISALAVATSLVVVAACLGAGRDRQEPETLAASPQRR